MGQLENILCKKNMTAVMDSSLVLLKVEHNQIA